MWIFYRPIVAIMSIQLANVMKSYLVTKRQRTASELASRATSSVIFVNIDSLSIHQHLFDNINKQNV